MVTFQDVSTVAGKSDWKLTWVEGMALLDKNWTLFPGFEIGQIVLHMSHDTGATTTNQAKTSSTLVIFNSILTLRGESYIVGVTHDGQQQSTCVEINAKGKSLDIIGLMEHCIGTSLSFEIPNVVSKEISSMLAIKPGKQLHTGVYRVWPSIGSSNQVTLYV